MEYKTDFWGRVIFPDVQAAARYWQDGFRAGIREGIQDEKSRVWREELKTFSDNLLTP